MGTHRRRDELRKDGARAVLEPQFQRALDCALLAVGNCTGEGFSGTPPACGASGNWIRCVETVPPLPAICTSENVEMRRMPCH